MILSLRFVVVPWLYVWLVGRCSSAFQFRSSVGQHRRHHQALSVAQVKENDTMDNENVFNGGGLMLQADAKSQLFASFSALSLRDQYDAVLTGLCAKIVDNNDSNRDAATIFSRLEDPIQLLQEMNSKRIMASPRSMMALIDVRKMSARQLCPPPP